MNKTENKRCNTDDPEMTAREWFQRIVEGIDMKKCLKCGSFRTEPLRFLTFCHDCQSLTQLVRNKDSKK